jgi:endoglucanase
VLEKLRRDLLTAADTIVRNHDSHLYGRGLRASYWGINGSIARTTFNLWAAWKLTGDEKYRQVAFDQVSYLYGRNPFGRSFVTGDGFMPPMHPHHRPSVGDDVVPPWPGHLLGGPQPAEMNWYDDQADASTNENCLNWDAALVFALAWFYEPQEG